MSTSGPMIGFTVGTLLAGLGMQWHWITESALFEGLAVLLAMSILAVWFSIETVPANRPSIRSVLKPSFGLAPAARGVFPLCASGFIGTWALTCFFQGFSARIAGDVFFHGEPNAFFASITYLLLIVPNALGGLLCGRLQPQRCIVGITGLFFLAGNGIFFCPALHLPSFFFIVSLVLCGFSQGAITALSLKVLVAKTTITDRAQTISTLYLCGYIGTGIPVLMLAAAAPQASLFMIAQGFFVWFAATFSCCIFFARRAFFRAADSE